MNQIINIQNDILPEPTLRRLPWYLAYVKLLRSAGVEYVSSTQISKNINVDASKIAKDLSFIHISGKTRVGYEVVALQQALEDFLGFKRVHKAFVVGAGSLGGALMQDDSGLLQYGLNIVAGFDVSPDKIGTDIHGIPVYNMNEFQKRQSEYNSKIGILTVPVEFAQEVADTMVKAGMKAIWNFTPYRIHVPEDIVLQNTSIYSHLALIFNRLQD